MSVYDFAVQILGFALCSYSMVCAYRFEVTAEMKPARWHHFWEGVVLHILAWVPFFIHLGALQDSISESVATTETSASLTGVNLALAGTITTYALYPIVTAALVLFDMCQYIYVTHTVLSAVAKNVLACGIVEATRHF